MNDDAALYQQSNTLQKRDALQCLQEYAKKIKWNYYDTVVDIGCGDGGVTANILRQFLPHDYKRVVGYDVNERMVRFANEHHGDHRTSFSVLNIGGELPAELKGSFDHAFSFYTLHWIKDQELVFKNIFSMLANGGDCLLIFLGHMPIFDIFRTMAKMRKWGMLLRDVERYVSPYHDSTDPEKEVRRTMAKIGFKNIEVQCKEMLYVYDSPNDLKKAVLAVNPFKIPLESQDEFLEEYMNIVRNMRLVDKVNNNIDGIRANYSLLVAYGTK